MKQIFTFTASALLLASCQQIDLGDKISSVVAQDDTYSVLVTSKSGDSNVDIPMPLTIYATNADGLVEKRASVTEEGATLVNLSLVSGDYTFYAIAGADAGDDDVPANNMVTAENGFFTKPIMRCAQNGTVDDDTELPLTLSYAVAAVDFTLSSIPADVKAVTVKLTGVRESMNLAGEYAGTTTATFDLTKQSDGTTWKSATAYVFPTVSAPTSLTITQTMTDDTNQSYTASYNAKLLEGTPYHFTGTGTNIANHELTVNVTAEGWESAIEEELTLTPIESGDGEGSIGTDGETYYVSEIPTESGTILDGKFVLAYVDGDKGLLFSKKDWSDMSANNADIQMIASDYNEDGLVGWSVPSEAQILKIKETYNNLPQAYTTLNEKLGKVAKGMILGKFSNLSNVWFLCENAEKKYNFNPGTITSLSGSDAQKNTFHLRLVKEVTFKLK